MRVLGLNITRAQKPDASLYTGYMVASLHYKKFLNIGAGGFTHTYWTNIDHATPHYRGELAPFVEHDLMSLKPMPFDSKSMEAAYMSHVAEHISDEAAGAAFREAHRILKPGGVFRLIGPDAMLYYDAWRRGDAKFNYSIPSYRKAQYLSGAMETPAQWFLFEFATELSTLSKKPVYKATDDEVIDTFRDGPTPKAFRHFTDNCHYSEEYAGYHVNWWTHAKALAMLEAAGFSEVYPSAYGQSRCPPMRDTNFFDKTHPKLSFYMEAVK